MLFLSEHFGSGAQKVKTIILHKSQVCVVVLILFSVFLVPVPTIMLGFNMFDPVFVV